MAFIASGRPTDASPRQWNRFAATFTVSFFLFVGVVYGSGWSIFFRAGELDPLETVIERQKQTGAVYRPAAIDVQDPVMRMRRFKYQRPHIIALGSSRVLMFRPRHFTKSFTNMGMSMDWIELPAFVDAMLDGGPRNLEVALIGLDHWQFHDETYKPGTPPPSAAKPLTPAPAGLMSWIIHPRQMFNQLLQDTAALIQSRVLIPLDFLKAGKIGLVDALRILCRCDPQRRTWLSNLGIAALIDHSGVWFDGGYFYADTFDPRYHIDGFKDILNRITDGRNSFEYADRVSPQRFSYLVNAVEALQRAGVKVILFLPPVAGPVAEAMATSGRYGVLDDLRRRAATLGVPFFDFHDPRQFGSSDCEFIDGAHGGEVTYLRMLRIMANSSAAGLASYVNMPDISARIQRFEGRVYAFDKPGNVTAGDRETDFLGLGCMKR
jgi:hypothetical protein